MSAKPGADRDPALFYSGLVADLYEPLASEHAKADDYVCFLDAAGAPALELCCGSGLPLLDLLARGYDVHGVDASADMLARCHAEAARRGLNVTLFEQRMQDLDVPHRYRAIFLAGASFTLLTSDEDARRTLDAMAAHLEPGGRVLVPLEVPDPALRPPITRETPGPDGATLRVRVMAMAIDPEARCHRSTLRLERVAADGTTETLERDWVRHWWTQAQFAAMLEEAGFVDVHAVGADGQTAPPEAHFFVFVARRPS
ncbi:class I SAM-dependent methyltransferase [Mycobacterium pseudokansasii]|uniref:class I SAM-dependent methyltransferase n=1 Tax=Mycobacterium pseudokansasii TaxID=2341080 RepID=UPI000F0174BE|nr:class I SAM-dependent methyltransferase [Mycobacterium pseudokansasii]VBA34240.1 Glycine/sarcosine N-methyltransferase [Mycobacterium pseudokansasii]VBA35713.1 Glycine/sarcosine N-methyltransferase [Mycobacterium pseudokansasii]